MDLSVAGSTVTQVDSEEQTRAVVNEFLRRSADGDPEAIAEMYAERIDWRVNWPVVDHPGVPWIRHRSTRADVVDHYRTFAETTIPNKGAITLDRILVDGASAVLIGTSTQVVRSTWRTFVMAFALHLTVEDGLITRHHMYEDSLAVAEAFQVGARA